MEITSWRAVRRAGARIVLAVGLLGSPTGIAVILTAGTSGAAVQQAATAAAVSPSRQAVTPKVRREGILVLAGNGTAYDLDSRAANWDKSIGVAWVDQNIEYVPSYKGRPLLLVANEPTTDVLMGTRGHWTYQSCADARYDPSYSHNPNTIIGSALSVRHGICVITQNTFKPHSKKLLKADGGHYVLLVVKARTGSALTLQVIVWQ
jgi:hypothetical protein